MSERLFSSRDLGNELRNELRKTTDVVSAYNADALLDRTDDEVVADLLDALSMPALDIRWEDAWSPGPEETRLDVQHDWSYGGAGEGLPVLIPADQVRIHVPYTGERMLLQLQPSSFRFTWPTAQITPNHLVHTVTGASLTSQQIAGDFNRWRSDVEFYANAVNSDVQAHNAELERQLREQVAARRQRLLKQRDLASSLPFQVRPATSEATYPLPMRRHEGAPDPAATVRALPAGARDRGCDVRGHPQAHRVLRSHGRARAAHRRRDGRGGHARPPAAGAQWELRGAGSR